MCFYDGDSDGPCDIYIDTRPRARKPHNCCECGGRIEPGEMYRRIKSLFDGSFTTEIVCDRCEAVRTRIHEVELARGCREHESWCPVGLLRDAIHNDGEGHYGLFAYGDNIDHVHPIAAHLFPRAVVGLPGAQPQEGAA